MTRSADELIFQRDGFRCKYCDFDGSTFRGWVFLQVDHLKPRSRGGQDADENLVTACIVCNQMKGAFAFGSIVEAREAITGWRNQMHDFWQTKVRPLLPGTQ